MKNDFGVRFITILYSLSTSYRSSMDWPDMQWLSMIEQPRSWCRASALTCTACTRKRYSTFILYLYIHLLNFRDIKFSHSNSAGRAFFWRDEESTSLRKSCSRARCMWCGGFITLDCPPWYGTLNLLKRIIPASSCAWSSQSSSESKNDEWQ